MAVMLRTIGIPSRVVNGFRSDEFNDITGNYIVRAKDAHSWVEAYFPGYGWQTFDPTPAGNVGPHKDGDDCALHGRHGLVLARLGDQLRQLESVCLGHTAISTSRNMWEGARSWARERYDVDAGLGAARSGSSENSPRRWH